MLNAKQASQEFWNGKKIAEGLRNKKEEIGKFTQKILNERGHNRQISNGGVREQ